MTNPQTHTHLAIVPVGIASRPRYATIQNWTGMSGMGRTTTYDEIGRGNLRAIKVGARTLIDVEHGFAWLASLPPASIRAPKLSAA